jgi:hypothetical protein
VKIVLSESVLTQNTFAGFVSWREFICFFLAKAPRSPRNSVFDLFLTETPLRALRLGESQLFYSLAEAQRIITGTRDE